jgi:hypothetical protein
LFVFARPNQAPGVKIFLVVSFSRLKLAGEQEEVDSRANKSCYRLRTDLEVFISKSLKVNIAGAQTGGFVVVKDLERRETQKMRA